MGVWKNINKKINKTIYKVVVLNYQRCKNKKIRIEKRLCLVIRL